MGYYQRHICVSSDAYWEFNNMEVSELNTQRFDVALELMQEGKSLTFDGVDFWISPAGKLRVAINSSLEVSNTTDQTALNDLERANKVLNYLIHESPEFASLVENFFPEFHLCHDYGTGVIELARIVDNKLVWA